MVIKNITHIFLKNVVLFPGVEAQIDITNDTDFSLIKRAFNNDLDIFISGYDVNGNYDTGVIARVRQAISIKNASNAYSAVVYPYAIAKKSNASTGWNENSMDSVEILDEINTCSPDEEAANINIIRKVVQGFAKIINIPPSNIPDEIINPADLSSQIYFAAVFIIHTPSIQQQILEELSVILRAKLLIKAIKSIENQIEIERQLDEEMQGAAERYQNEYFLQEKYNEIKRRLGKGEDFADGFDDDEDEVDVYRNKLSALPLPKDTINSLLKECRRFSLLHPSSPDANLIRNYFDEILSLPWGKYSLNPFFDTHDALQIAKAILDANHFGLDKVKERFIYGVIIAL